jgi:sugar O-acyltransferase (sialic acid O-acetyltransferase NeuD family)
VSANIPTAPEIIGIGAGGHARVLVDLIRLTGKWTVHGLLDQDPARNGTKLDDVPVLGDDSLAEPLLESGIRHAFLGVGCIGDCRVRQEIIRRLTALGYHFPVLLHPQAIVAGRVLIGPASCAMAGAIINPGTSVGTAAIINSGAIIEHDCHIGDHAHISPGAILGGGVTVGESSHVGIGAVVRQGIHIGSNALIGAGAVVVKDVADGTKVMGVPAREHPRTP